MIGPEDEQLPPDEARDIGDQFGEVVFDQSEPRWYSHTEAPFSRDTSKIMELGSEQDLGYLLLRLMSQDEVLHDFPEWRVPDA